MRVRGYALAASLFVVLPAPARAQSAATAPAGQAAAAGDASATQLQPVEVIGSTPLLGSGVARDRVPAETSVLKASDVNRTGMPQAVRALEDKVPGVNLGDSAGNPFQPNLFYHGFEASPLQGTPQGLAVYMNGVRFNQAFGDTVNWDLIPDVAIDQMNLVGSSPVFGLNALGGALSVQMKNGFTYHGGELTAFGGSFAKYGTNLQYGLQRGDTAGYIALSAQHQGGWRDMQSSNLYQVYGDVGWRSDRAEVHLNFAGADNALNGPGTAPVELLAADRAAQFTAPNRISNKYGLVSLNGNVDINDTTSLQAVAYYNNFWQFVTNGNATDFAPCDDGSGFLCQAQGVFATDKAGNPIPDFLAGGPYSQLDQQTTNTNGYGVSAQVTNTNPVFGRPNQLVAGVSYDGAQIMFGASSAIGGLDAFSRAFIGPGIILDQADGSVVPVRVAVSNAYYGVFFTDTLAVTDRLSLNVAGRFNAAQINLKDQNGAALNGNHSYSHFNPAGGLTYRILPQLSAYASYAVANRAPTPAELSCADPAAPCSLANFFVGDPDLKQVISYTFEAGLRGSLKPFEGATLGWTLGYYHATLNNDIIFVNSPVQGRAFFQNVGSTLRQGLDAGATLTTPRLLAWLNFAWVNATFQTPFTAASPDNPAADGGGNIFVQKGNQLPGIPPYQLKLGFSYQMTEKWSVGANAIYGAGQYLFGDEANLTPKLPAYFVLNLTTQYQVLPGVTLFANVQNVTNQKYYTYGTFSPTSSVAMWQAPGASNPRSYSPAAPVGAYGGVRVTF